MEPGAWTDVSSRALLKVTEDCGFAGGHPGNHFNGAFCPWAGNVSKLEKMDSMAPARTMRNSLFLENRPPDSSLESRVRNRTGTTPRS